MKYPATSCKHTSIREICGRRWPRLMEIEDAAAYVGLSAGTFKKRFPQLIRPYIGEKFAVAKDDLDAIIDSARDQFKSECEAVHA